MTFLKKLFVALWNLFDRLLCVALAFGFSMVPSYLQQYQDTLGEVRNRAQATYIELDARAAQFNLDVDSYLNRQDLVPDSLREAQPQLMKDIVARYREYDASYRALSLAPDWKKPFVFLKEYDKSIRTALTFQPIMTLTWVSAAYALLGILVALSLVGLVIGLLTRIRRRFNKPPPVYDPYKYRRKDQT